VDYAALYARTFANNQKQKKIIERREEMSGGGRMMEKIFYTLARHMIGQKNCIDFTMVQILYNGPKF